MEGSDMPSWGCPDRIGGVRLLVAKSGAPVAMLDGKSKANRQADELLSGDILEVFGGAIC